MDDVVDGLYYLNQFNIFIQFFGMILTTINILTDAMPYREREK